MGQLILPDNIPPLIKASTTTCTLASTNMGQPTRITIGGQQYKLSSTLTLNTATTGLGGLDTGALGSAFQLYYVYACTNTSGVVGLVASLTGPSTGPSGFTSRYQLVGAFYVSDTAVIGSTITINGTAETDWISFTPTSTWISNATHTGRMKRRSNVMDMDLLISLTGAPTATSLTFNMPGSFQMDETSMATETAARKPVSLYGQIRGTGSSSYAAGLVHIGSGNPSTLDAVVLSQSANTVIYIDRAITAITNTVPETLGAGLYLSFKVENLPIAGWTKTLLG